MPHCLGEGDRFITWSSTQVVKRFFFCSAFVIIPSMSLNKPVKSTPASNREGGSVNLNYVDTPDECPLCFVSLVPRFVTSTFGGSPNQPNSVLQMVFQCTQDDCQGIFIAAYTYSNDPNKSAFQIYDFIGLAPKNPPKANFPASVEEVSSDFILIYNQAIAAEAAGLDLIAGIGLRKALEFLIKDFSINQHPTKTAEIKSANLGKCITEYCDDVRLQRAGARAVWLGNDEAHYTKTWIDRDITDLKTLIRLSVNWMENVLLTQQYDKEMDPANPPEIPDSAAATTEPPNELS